MSEAATESAGVVELSICFLSCSKDALQAIAQGVVRDDPTFIAIRHDDVNYRTVLYKGSIPATYIVEAVSIPEADLCDGRSELRN